MTKLCKLLALVLILTGSAALAQPEERAPAWQLIAAEAGLPATAEFRLPADVPVQLLDRVEIPGVPVRDLNVLTDERAIRIRIDDPGGQPVFIDSLILDLGQERRTVQVIPTEIHWLRLPGTATDLRVPYMESLHTTPMVLAVVVHNISQAPLELTDLRFAPRAVTTGRLLLARDFGQVSGRPEFKLPFIAGGTLEYDPQTWDGIPFTDFTFAHGPLTLAPDEQVLLLASGMSMTEPELFNDSYTSEWAPWLEYRIRNQDWHHLLVRSRRSE